MGVPVGELLRVRLALGHGQAHLSLQTSRNLKQCVQAIAGYAGGMKTNVERNPLRVKALTYGKGTMAGHLALAQDKEDEMEVQPSPNTLLETG